MKGKLPPCCLAQTLGGYSSETNRVIKTPKLAKASSVHLADFQYNTYNLFYPLPPCPTSQGFFWSCTKMLQSKNNARTVSW